MWYALNYRITLAMRTTDSDSVLACQCRKDRESVRVALRFQSGRHRRRKPSGSAGNISCKEGSLCQLRL